MQSPADQQQRYFRLYGLTTKALARPVRFLGKKFGFSPPDWLGGPPRNPLGDFMPKLTLAISGTDPGTEVIPFGTPGVNDPIVERHAFYRQETDDHVAISFALQNVGKVPVVVGPASVAESHRGAVRLSNDLVMPNEFVRVNLALMKGGDTVIDTPGTRLNVSVQYSDVDRAAQLFCRAEIDPSWGIRLI